MFKTDLTLTAISGRPDQWYVGAPLVWEFAGLTITVPVGFITDLASIPKIIDWVPDLNRTGLTRRPGCLHDWLYGGERWHGKAFADSMLYQACIAEGMDPRGATAVYEGVHLFGKSSWDEDGTKRMADQFHTPTDYFAWLRSGPHINPVGAV